MEFQTIRPCKSSAAIEAIPKGKVKLDLAVLETRIQSSKDFSVEANVKSLLVINGAVRISVYPSGKILFKTKELGAVMEEIEKLDQSLESACIQ